MRDWRRGLGWVLGKVYFVVIRVCISISEGLDGREEQETRGGQGREGKEGVRCLGMLRGGGRIGLGRIGRIGGRAFWPFSSPWVDFDVPSGVLGFGLARGRYDEW